MGRGKSILCNSGSEAVEAALKTALLHSGKPGVISFTGGYHGLGLGALETIGMPAFREPFQSQLARFAVKLPYPGCFRCPFGRREGFRLEGNPFPNCSTSCLEELQEQIVATLRQREIGCILVEPIQGRGGEIVPPRDFLVMLRRICDSEKLLLVLDEIYTGFNRTGKLFACEHFGITPDLICLGKSLTGGFPLSACVGRGDIMDAWPASQGEALHTSTTLGNPLGCAMALASIKEHLEDGTRHLARNAGRKLKDALLALKAPCVGNVRGVGALLGVELVKRDGEPYSSLAAAVMRQGLAGRADSPRRWIARERPFVRAALCDFRLGDRVPCRKTRRLSRPLARFHFVVEREPLRNIRLDDLLDELHMVGVFRVQSKLLPRVQFHGEEERPLHIRINPLAAPDAEDFRNPEQLDSGFPHHPLKFRLVHLWFEFEEDQMINHGFDEVPG